MTGASAWHVVVPDPWIWESWMFDELRQAGCRLALGTPAFDPDARPLDATEMARRLADADGVILHSRESIPEAALDTADRLIVISKMGIGVDKIDVEAATRRGIVVTNTPVPNDYHGIAEGSVTLILALAKQLVMKNDTVRAGRWRDPTTAGMPLRGRTIGLIGLGRVGGRVAELLTPWDATLVAYDPFADPERAEQLGVKLVELDELLEASDIVSLHAVVTADSKHLINGATLAKMRPGSYLVNTARGALIDETALVEALESGHLAGAALDVFQVEPLPMDHPLRSVDNVILTPHAIGTSRDSQVSICRAAVRSCLDALSGTWPSHPVNPEVESTWRGRRGEAE